MPPGDRRAPVGLMLGATIPPEALPGVARLGEELGFGELWFAEDCFFTGGISGSTAALAATERIPVGLGIVPAVVRHPALLAMEIATVSRMFPGRLLPGIGLGVPDWIRQMGLHPPSPLQAMRECVTALRRLLDGQELTSEGRIFAFDRVKLTHPPTERVPLYMGVVGPKMLELSGEIADGTVVSVIAAPSYVEWALGRIEAGAERAERSGPHSVVCYALFSVGADSAAAKASVRGVTAFYLDAMRESALLEVHGSAAELAEILDRGGVEGLARELPEAWLDELVIAGDPDECAAKIRRFLAAGADSVILFPAPPERAEEIVRLAASEVLPRV